MLSKTMETVLNTNNPKLRKELEKVKKCPEFQEVMQNVREEFFTEYKIHGISHNERTVIYACLIGLKEGLTHEELLLVLKAALIHDIGRVFMRCNHGELSAKLIARNREVLFPNHSDEEINMIRALSHGHSIEDNKYDEYSGYWKNYDIKDVEKLLKLLRVLKDADALDRARLKKAFGRLNPEKLRTSTSKEYIQFAEELVSEYIRVEQAIPPITIDYKSNYVFHQGLRDQLITDGESYYLLHSLNKTDIETLESGRGIEPKAEQEGGYTFKDILGQIKEDGNRKTSLTSMSEDPNVFLADDQKRKRRFVLIKLSKEEIENFQKVFSVGEYLLGVMDAQIAERVAIAPEYVKKIIEDIDQAESIDNLVQIINGVDKDIDTNLLESQQQYLDSHGQLEQSIKIAKFKVLFYYGLMRGIGRDEDEKIIELSRFLSMMQEGYDNSQWLYAGNIDQSKIIDIAPIWVDTLALLKQAEFQGKDKAALQQIERMVLSWTSKGFVGNVPGYQLEYSNLDKKQQELAIDDAFEITGGEKGYLDVNMQQSVIRSLAEMILNKRAIVRFLDWQFPDIDVTELLSDAICINPELTTRMSNKGNPTGKNVSFIISENGTDFDEETSMQILQNVNMLTDEQLHSIVTNGLKSNELLELLPKNKLPKNPRRKKALYVAESIVEGYDWRKDGNSLTDKEKKSINNKLLLGKGGNPEGILRLYTVLKRAALLKKITPSEISGIIINIALEGRLGDVQYSELLEKSESEIQELLLSEKESLNPTVTQLSVDYLTKGKKFINQIKKEFGNLGITKELLDSREPDTLFLVKKIVDSYESNTTFSEKQKKAIISVLLEMAANTVEKGFTIDKLIDSPKRLVEYVRMNPGIISSDVTEDVLEAAVKRMNTKRKVTAAQIARATIEPTISEECDRAQAACDSLMKANEIESSEMEDEE